MAKTSKKERDNKFFIIVILAAAVILLAFSVLQQSGKYGDLSNSCIQSGGTWVANYKECEWISEDTCTALDGSFNECDSACRHESSPVACTTNCVAVCNF